MSKSYKPLVTGIIYFWKMMTNTLEMTLFLKYN